MMTLCFTSLFYATIKSVIELPSITSLCTLLLSSIPSYPFNFVLCYIYVCVLKLYNNTIFDFRLNSEKVKRDEQESKESKVGSESEPVPSKGSKLRVFFGSIIGFFFQFVAGFCPIVGEFVRVLWSWRNKGHASRRLSSLSHVCYVVGGWSQMPQVQEYCVAWLPQQRRKQ